MKKYILALESKPNESLGCFDSKIAATDELDEIISENNRDLDEKDDEYLTPFDFILKEVEFTDSVEGIESFEAARKYLGIKANDVAVRHSMTCFNEVFFAKLQQFAEEVNPHHIEALIALNKLFTIAEAWNKADGFEPDFSNASQYKYYPWFVYDKGAAGFVYAYTNASVANTAANVASRLCFKTAERAKQFGKQFAHLYNIVFQ